MNISEHSQFGDSYERGDLAEARFGIEVTNTITALRENWSEISDVFKVNGNKKNSDKRDSAVSTD